MDKRPADKLRGERFGSARHDAGFATAQDFADALGISVNTVRAWEAGRTVPDNPNMERVVALTGKTRNYFHRESDEDRLAEALERSQRQIDELRRQMENRSTMMGDDGLPVGARRVEGMTLLPILGRVTAGRGGIAEENIGGYKHLPTTFIPDGQESSCFLVEASGESMADAGIATGDLLLVCNAVQVNDGDVAIVDVDGEAMVKRVFIRNGDLVLSSDNPSFAPIIVKKARLVGRVMKIMRDVYPPPGGEP